MAESTRTGFQETVECDSCEGTENVYHYCIQCPGNICDTCKVTHCKTRLTRNHRILPRTHPEVQQSRLSTKVYCKLHHDKEYMYVTFCTRCKTPCCPTCISSDHSSHTFSDLGEEIAKVEREMNDIASNFEAHKIPEAEKVLKTISNAMSDYKISADKVKQSAEARIQQLHTDVDCCGRQFMDALDAQIKNDITQMEDEMKKVQDTLLEMKKSANVCRTSPADTSLLMKRDRVKRIMDKTSVRISLPECLTFNESHPCISVDMIGHFKQKKTTQVGDRHLFQNSAEMKMDEIGEMKVVNTINQGGDKIIHMADGQTWILYNYNEKIYVLDENFEVKNTIELTCKLNDITLANYREIGVICVIATAGSTIMQIGTTDRQFILKNFAPFTQEVSGICIHMKLGLVVRISNPFMLRIYTTGTLSLLNEIEKDENGKALFRAVIHRIEPIVTGECLVAFGSEIICFSKDWKVRWRCELSNEVWALCCDCFNNILVVQRFAKQLTMIRCENGKITRTIDLEFAEISDPLSLSFDRKGLLWVGQKRKVTIISYIKQ